ncbi:MAG: hypothetical protein U0795_10590 [Pirellulales bacterium]
MTVEYVNSADYVQITKLAASGATSAARQVIDEKKDQLSESVRLTCLGNCLFYEGSLQEAIEQYETAMMASTAHDVARYHYLLGVQAELSGNYEEAHGRYEAAITIEPSFVDTYVEMGGLFVKFEEYEVALGYYERALELDDTDLRNYSNVVSVLSVLQKQIPREYKMRYRRAVSNLEIAKQRLPPERRTRW